MKHVRIHIPSLSYIAAFAIGVILFAFFEKRSLVQPPAQSFSQ
jgi:hypothetical protein